MNSFHLPLSDEGLLKAYMPADALRITKLLDPVADIAFPFYGLIKDRFVNPWVNSEIIQ
ncbi:MAG: hypothetical protein SVE93_07210 [Candidatus Thermoplasmatota archaeon]|nr:hypothetical protein [Candidatus Thermoplasmatota archaeon]